MAIRPRAAGYPYFHFSSGMCSKLMPYMPATRVSGSITVESMVKSFMTSFMRNDCIDKCISSTLVVRSR